MSSHCYLIRSSVFVARWLFGFGYFSRVNVPLAHFSVNLFVHVKSQIGVGIVVSDNFHATLSECTETV